jgi:hypothetical protein
VLFLISRSVRFRIAEKRIEEMSVNALLERFKSVRLDNSENAFGSIVEIWLCCKSSDFSF